MTETVIRIPTLETDRLRLRAPKAADFETYAAFRASDRAGFLGGPFTRAQSFEQMAALVGHWQLRGYGRWIVADRGTDTPLGVVGLFFPEGWPEPELAWTVFDGAEGRGMAFEAALRARAYAYEVAGWSTAVSLIARGNPRSISLARRLGAEREGEFPHETLGMLDIYRHPPPERRA